MALAQCSWCGRTFESPHSTNIIDTPICSDRCRQEQRANSKQQWNQTTEGFGRVIDAFVQANEASRQEQEAAEYEAMVAAENRRLLEQQQRLIHRDSQLKQLIVKLSDSLNRSEGDAVGQLSAIDEFESEVRTNSFVVTDLQHIADRQSFNEIALRAEELLNGVDRKTQEQFRKFKALYDTYSKEFLGKSQFPKPESEEFTEKPLVTQFPTPMPVAPQLEVQNSRELVEPNDELIALRKKKTAMYWAIGVAIVLNVPLPVLGAIAAVAIYYFGVRSVKESLAPLEQEYEKEVERVRQSKQAELNDEHQQAVADWEKSKAEFEARIPSMNEEIEKHNASVRERCAEAQAKWERRREKAASAINGFIARHPSIEVRFSPVGEVQQERDDDLRKTFGVKSAHQTDQRS